MWCKFSPSVQLLELCLLLASVAIPLVNLTVLSSHILWTVVQIEAGLMFSGLYSKILNGGHPKLLPSELLCEDCTLDKVLVGQTKEPLSVVDEQLVIDDVCPIFGQHIKLYVTPAPT